MSEPAPQLLDAGRRGLVGERPTEVAAPRGDRRSGRSSASAVASDRSAAEALRGEQLRAPRGGAPPLEEDEYWAEDLEGCTVVDGGRERRAGSRGCWRIRRASCSRSSDGPAARAAGPRRGARRSTSRRGASRSTWRFLGEEDA